ncbi:MAG: hypothetical protein ACT4R6_10850 [Gemmatimonadaceae bacterium]
MRFRTLTALLGTAVILAACSDSATGPTPDLESELDEVVLETQTSAALDRRPGAASLPFNPPFPDDLKLTDAQKKCISDAFTAFREANAAALAELHAIHKKAREAKQAGASREEIRKILEAAKPILERLRPAHAALHEKVLSCLTQAQRDWLAANRKKRG